MRIENTNNSGSTRTCFVMQPSSNPHFDDLYREVFRGAIEATGLMPLRLKFDDGESSESSAFETVERQVQESVACFVDLTQQDPRIWYALGCAFALGKPLCCVASADDTSATASFAGSHLNTILYSKISLPSDYRWLRQQITERLRTQRNQVNDARRDWTDANHAGLSFERLALATDPASMMDLIHTL